MDTTAIDFTSAVLALYGFHRRFTLSRITEQEGQHPLTGQHAANFRLLANQ